MPLALEFREALVIEKNIVLSYTLIKSTKQQSYVVSLALDEFEGLYRSERSIDSVGRVLY